MVEDAAVRSAVTRLARPHPSGGDVIERAAILAEGADSPAILAWVVAHALPPEAQTERSSGGLHGSRLADGGDAAVRTPLRFIMPPGLCD